MAGKLNKHDVPTPQQRGSPAYGLQTKFRFSKSENKLNQKEKSEQNLKLIKVSETNQIEAKMYGRKRTNIYKYFYLEAYFASVFALKRKLSHQN